jgi:hypothetical protein
MKQLPLYFAVKKDEADSAWPAYLEWWNNQYGEYAHGLPTHYVYYGRSTTGDYTNGYMASVEINSFPSSVKIITLEEWKNIVNPKS